MRFGRINEIIPEKSETWKNKIFLTFDIDWAHDEIIVDTLDLLEDAKVPATFFVTHPTPILNRIRKNKNFELGVHPNFNFILQGISENGGTALEIVTKLMRLVPEAKSYRSHSLTTGTYIQNVANAVGLTHDVNLLLPLQSTETLAPYRLWDKFIRVPYVYCDYTSCMYEIKKSAKEYLAIAPLPVVFDFHPIHIYLNTDTLNLYERSRIHHQNPKILRQYRTNSKFGSREMLLDVLTQGLAI